MANKREKGKIPRSEWSTILAKYSGGETIAQIGRDYGCTGPAIRYIIKRNGMLKDQSGGARAAALGGRVRTSSPESARDPGVRRPVASAPLAATLSERPGNIALEPELRQRVSGDVASFLVALDHVVLEGSLASVADLQEATDRLMRSIARTRLELEHLVSRREMPRPRDQADKRVGFLQRGT
jgi:hypothetical protein